MKKLLVVLLTVALSLSVVAMASAATFSGSVGGEFQLNAFFDKTHENQNFFLNSGSGNSMIKAYMYGTVEQDNTWAKIGTKLTCWNVPKFDLVYSAGIKKIADKLDITYSTDDLEATLRGLTPMWQDGMFNKYGGDPFFTHRLSNGFAFDWNGENLVANVTVVPNKGTNDSNPFVGALTYKFESGNVYAGYSNNGDKSNDYTVGGEFKAGFGTIKAQYVGGNTSASTTKGNSVQATVSFDEAKLAATVLYDGKYQFADDSSIGAGIEYTGFEKVTLGAKYISNDQLTNAYVGYKFGVFDTQLGWAKTKTYTDGVVYVSAHVGMW